MLVLRWMTKSLTTSAFERLLKLAADDKRAGFVSGYEEVTVVVASSMFMLWQC